MYEVKYELCGIPQRACVGASVYGGTINGLFATLKQAQMFRRSREYDDNMDDDREDYQVYEVPSCTE
jgi:hypothetical protein